MRSCKNKKADVVLKTGEKVSENYNPHFHMVLLLSLAVKIITFASVPKQFVLVSNKLTFCSFN